LKTIVVFLFSISLIFGFYNTNQAQNHIGENIEVCGKIKEIYHHKNGHIFLDLDGKYPNQKMTLIIWNDYKNNFNNINFKNKYICVKGFIKTYKDKIEMFLENKSQIVTIK